jgi:hypothetical protein
MEQSRSHGVPEQTVETALRSQVSGLRKNASLRSVRGMPDQNHSGNTLHQPKTAFRSAYELGRQAYLDSTSGMPDPAGEEHERERLRALGKWRFIVLRGALGVGLPMFVWLALTSQRAYPGCPPLPPQHFVLFASILGSWDLHQRVFGLILGLLAWRRVTSDY